MSTKISRSKLRELLRNLIMKELEEASTTASAGGNQGQGIHYDTPKAFASGSDEGKGHPTDGEVGGYTKAEQVNEVMFAVKISKDGSELQTIVDASSKGQAKTKVARMLKGGMKDIIGVSRVQPAFGKQIDKKLESTTEGKKQYGQKLTDDFFKSVKKFEQEVIILGKMATKIRGDRTDEKIILKSYKKQISPFIALIRSWNSTTQKNPAISELKEGHYHTYRNDDSLSAKQKIGHSMREVRDKLTELSKLIDMNVKLKNELSVDSKSYWKNTHKAMSKISERLVKLANKVGKLQ